MSETTSPPRIGITTYGCIETGNYRLPAEYVHAVRRAGGEAILLPPGGNPAVWLPVLQGIIFAGGGDIDPSRYGSQPHPTNYNLDHQRDEGEMQLIQAWLDWDTPIPAFAICRGMQLLNVVLGGTLHNHLPEFYGESVMHRLPPREPVVHPVNVQPESRLANVLATVCPIPVSWHHQAVDRLGAGLSVVASATDNVIEGMALAGREDLLAVQWHPEMSAADDPSQQRLFHWLVQAAKTTH